MILSEFEKKWVHNVEEDILRYFPDDFIQNTNLTLLNLPGKPLLKGSELFGNFEIIDIDGNVLLSTDNLDKVKYILYSNRNNPTKIKIPLNNNSIAFAVKDYENHLDNIVKMIRMDFESEFPKSDKTKIVINKIFQLVNLHRY